MSEIAEIMRQILAVQTINLVLTVLIFIALAVNLYWTIKVRRAQNQLLRFMVNNRIMDSVASGVSKITPEELMEDLKAGIKWKVDDERR